MEWYFILEFVVIVKKYVIVESLNSLSVFINECANYACEGMSNNQL